MDSIIEGLKDLTQTFLTENPNMTYAECIERFYTLSPGFRHDEIFAQVMPAVYGLITCQIKIAEAEREKQKSGQSKLVTNSARSTQLANSTDSLNSSELSDDTPRL